MNSPNSTLSCSDNSSSSEGRLELEAEEKTYKTEFPNFDDPASCERLMDLGFDDLSNRNENDLPRFVREDVEILVDFMNPDPTVLVNIRQNMRFSVYDWNDGFGLFSSLDEALKHHTMLVDQNDKR